MTAELFPPAEHRVWRVMVFDQRFKTVGGLGVGSTLGQIRARYQVEMLVGEDAVFAHVEELYMSLDFGPRWYRSARVPKPVLSKTASTGERCPIRDLR